MLTAVLVVVAIFLAFRWFQKRRMPNLVKDNKPDWAIGYAMYFLCDLFSRGHNDDEVLSLLTKATQNGLPDLDEFSAQSTIVGLKAYAYNQRDLERLIDRRVILSLSQVVAVEARTALQMAASRLNIESYLKEFDPNIDDAELQNAVREIFISIRKPTLTANDKRSFCELLRHYLTRFFERQHGKPFDEYAAYVSRELVEASS